MRRPLRDPPSVGSAFLARGNGLFLGYGWINVITECKFSKNGFALHLENNINSVQVMNNIMENNRGAGIYGMAARPSSFRKLHRERWRACYHGEWRSELTIRGNYYEANNVAPAGLSLSRSRQASRLSSAPTSSSVARSRVGHSTTQPDAGQYRRHDASRDSSGNLTIRRCRAAAMTMPASLRTARMVSSLSQSCERLLSESKHKHAPKCTPLVAGPAVVNTSYRS